MNSDPQPTPRAGSRISIIVPVLDEGRTLAASLSALRPLRDAGVQVVVVDGGSRDDTLLLARAGADVVVAADRGRGAQLNAGAVASAGDILLFLHADTRLPGDVVSLVLWALGDNDGSAPIGSAPIGSSRRRSVRGSSEGRNFARTAALPATPGRPSAHRRPGAPRPGWGRFDVRIDSDRPVLRLVSLLMNWRSRLTGITTGDQAMFVERDLFDSVGGFADIPLMEDIVLSAALRRHSRPARVAERVHPSARGWERRGPVRTIALMWELRLRFALGADPRALALRYGYQPR